MIVLTFLKNSTDANAIVTVLHRCESYENKKNLVAGCLVVWRWTKELEDLEGEPQV